MHEVTIICDRCNTVVEDAMTDGQMTAGYYEVAFPSFWSNFADPDEFHLCDDCMFKDPRYVEVYGVHSTN